VPKKIRTISVRLPEDAWRRLHELAAELTQVEGKVVSSNTVLTRLVRTAKAQKLSAGGTA